jgi:alpha-N-arabinofuranosidase
LLDDHFYISIPAALSQAHLYDNYDRAGTKIFVGEWATNKPQATDTPHMAFALGDAAWLTGLERNADVVVMNCYAPLFVNVNPGGRQWAVDLIGYNALTSFGSPSYYVQKMFSNNRGDVVLGSSIDGLPRLTPEQIPQAPAPVGGARNGRGNGGNGAATAPTAAQAQQPPQQFDGIYAVATQDNASGDVILKLVNVQATAQPMNINLQGVSTIAREAKGEVLADEPGAMNSLAEPTKTSPKPITITNAGTKFSHELPAHSVSVIRLKTK